jgi:hypothetical protein
VTPILHAFAVGTLAIGAATGAVAVMTKDIPDLAVPDGDWQASGTLDGRVFHTVDRIVGSDEVMHDELHFVDGRFQSMKCQEYCDYGWWDYKTKQSGDSIHFTATIHCPDAPHTVVWYGVVTGDDVRFEGTWTARRWYWTRQIEMVGAGSSTPPVDTVTGT